MSTKIMYKGEVLDTIENESRKMTTANTLMEDHVTLVNEGGGSDGNISQDEDGYIVFDDGEYEEIEVRPRVYTVNRTDVARDGIGYNPVTVNVDNTKIILERNTASNHHLYLSQNITSIGPYAFYGCTALEEVDIPNNVESIGNYAFSGCDIKSIIIQEATSNLGQCMFINCKSIEHVKIFGEKTWTHNNGANTMFKDCTNLKSICAPNLKFRGNGNEFSNCTSLVDVYTPNLTVTTQTFTNCSSIESLVLCTAGCYSGSFSNCTNLKFIDFRIRTQFFRQSIFKNCTSLETIVLRGTTITPFSGYTADNVFENTPFAEGGSGGTIYIPKVLYDELGTGSSLDYKSDTNWSLLDSYGTITWEQIEGSEYENYYVDGRGVLQEITENLTNCSLDTPRSEQNMPHYGGTYTIKLLPDDGYTISSATITMGGTDITSTAYNSETNEITIENVNDVITITATAN